MFDTTPELLDMPLRTGSLLNYVAALRPQEGGRVVGRWNRCLKNRQISALYPPLLTILRGSFSEKYVRLREVDYLSLRVNIESYQDNLASNANAPSKLYHIDLKDYQGRFDLIIPKRNHTFAVSGNRRTY